MLTELSVREFEKSIQQTARIKSFNYFKISLDEGSKPRNYTFELVFHQNVLHTCREIIDVFAANCFAGTRFYTSADETNIKVTFTTNYPDIVLLGLSMLELLPKKERELIEERLKIEKTPQSSAAFKILDSRLNKITGGQTITTADILFLSCIKPEYQQQQLDKMGKLNFL
ncbi:hypothetical protein [Legionella shakespearei]|uniref:Uncharacterized protein n=1 Tax=Legionella shakespearei DSM 23087 TaxID=1122169 RepID=A0A0W0YVP3_9GAMM|nr:hypothetical protein [Legionella shakespearei]KTD60935.1 hypothetical protein Lsha_1346 [Legionella shakespearei DSM 23087]